MEISPPIPFVPFMRNGEVRIYFSRGLPHWRQRGATYFVTFRTVDSMPSGYRDEYLAKRDEWLREKGFDPEGDDWKKTIQESSPEVLEEYGLWCGEEMNRLLDLGAGACVLKKAKIAEVVETALEFYEPHQLRLGDFVVMPNHIHFLATPVGDRELESLVRSIKGYSANVINDELGASGAFWQAGFFDRLVRTGDELRRIQKYIRDNPANAGLAAESCLVGEADYGF